MPVEFQVQKNDLAKHRIVETTDRPLADGEVRLRVDKFAFTANNMTYGVAGYSLGYWQFFPASSNEDGLWGVIPVWAFADVIESENENVPVGDRLYGYFPPATSLIMQPKDVSTRAVTDGIAHRQALPPLYNVYQRVSADPKYQRDGDIARILLGPLHMTSYCLWDCLKQNDWYGADQVIIVSASSKTSLGLAHGLATDEAAPKTVGLTSARNVEFVTSTGLYDEVIAYGDLAAALTPRSSAVIDMAGNASVKAGLQEKLGENLSYYINVGITHWEDIGSNGGFSDTPNPERQENFFAPSYIFERIKQIGPREYDTRSTAFVRSSAEATFAWMSVDQRSGLDGLTEIYPGFCDGSVSPKSGFVIAM